MPPLREVVKLPLEALPESREDPQPAAGRGHTAAGTRKPTSGEGETTAGTPKTTSGEGKTAAGKGERNAGMGQILKNGLRLWREPQENAPFNMP